MDAIEEDVKYILELLKHLLPDFPANSDDLVKPKPSFAINFYHNYVTELEKQCQLLFSHPVDDDTAAISLGDIDRERYVFLFTRHILNELGIKYFSMSDFCRPTSRTKTTIKLCMYFMLYARENTSRVTEIIMDFYKKFKENNSTVEETTATKDEVNEITQNIGLLTVEDFKKECVTELQRECELEDKTIEVKHEIEDLLKDFEALKRQVLVQEELLNDIKDEIIELSDQISCEDKYTSFYKDILCDIQSRVADHHLTDDENVDLLEEKAVEVFKRMDMLRMVHTKGIINLEEKIKERESAKQKVINSQNEILKEETHSILSPKEQCVEPCSENKQIQLFDDFSDKIMQKKLVKEYNAVKKQLKDSAEEYSATDSSEEEYEILESQDLLEEPGASIY